MVLHMVAEVGVRCVVDMGVSMKQKFYMDVECYPNFFGVMLLNDDGKRKAFTILNGDRSTFNQKQLVKILSHPDAEIITFNGNAYDMPILMYALSGAGTHDLKRASDDIILNNLKPWTFYRKYGLNEPDKIDHIDLIEVAPSQCSLKIYGGRMHTQKMQDLPYDPDKVLTQGEAAAVMEYCGNDLAVTKELGDNLTQQIELRREMSKLYHTDLRSKSDSQIAEAVLKSEFKRITNHEPTKTQITYKSFPYIPPPYIKFNTPTLQEALRLITSLEFVIKETGHVLMPKEVETLKLTIGRTAYKLGIGGLHSQESEVCYSNVDSYIIDRDVVSYYPNLMLNMDMAPASFGKHFHPVYRKILEERVEAKRSGDKSKSDSLKITLNGTFGKTSSKYSLLYSPKMMLHTTLTGQLSLLMLIEALESYGIPVVSANTDGIVMLCPPNKYAGYEVIIQRWEKHCGLETEETQYKALYSRDVNSYIAITTDGKVKTKGAYASGGLMKNPQNEICAEAVIKHLRDGTPIENTVRECTDLKKFITVRTVTGGAIWREQRLGKAIRWYYSTECKGEEIFYCKNGNTVPRTMGAKPVMNLPEFLPEDVDYDWYINECEYILMDVGAKARPVPEKMPRKNSKAWKALAEAGRIKPGRTKTSKWVWN